MAPNLSGLMSGQKLSASNCPSTNCFRVNVSFANFLHSQYPLFANSSIGCKTKPLIFSQRPRVCSWSARRSNKDMKWGGWRARSQVRTVFATLQPLTKKLLLERSTSHCIGRSQHPNVTLRLINMVLLDDGDGYKESWALDKHIWRGGWVLRWTSISHHLETLWAPAIILQVCSVQPYIALRSLKPTL